MFEDIFPDNEPEIDGITVCPWQKGTGFNCSQFVGIKAYKNQPEKYSLCEYLNESDNQCRYEWHGSPEKSQPAPQPVSIVAATVNYKQVHGSLMPRQRPLGQKNLFNKLRKILYEKE